MRISANDMACAMLLKSPDRCKPFLVQYEYLCMWAAKKLGIREANICFSRIVAARAILHEAHIENLGLIRDSCTGIQTLKLSVPREHCNYALGHDVIAAEALISLLGMRFMSIPSLEQININFEAYAQQDSVDDVTKTMHGYTWTIKFTELPKKVLIFNNDRVEFDSEEDCDAYNNEQFRREVEEDEKRENGSGLEEYCRRRRGPCWKNDLEYD